MTISKGFGGSAIGKTKLDKERLLWCQREIENIINDSRNIKLSVNENNIKEQTKKVNKILTILNDMLFDVSIN